MKKSFIFLFIVFACLHSAYGQALHIDSTRFITGNKCCTNIQYVIPTTDKGILFTGADNNNPGGIIPYFPTDTSTYGNVLIGKIDSNRQISWIKVYGGSQRDEGMSACQTPDGGYAVLATTMSYDGNVTSFNTGQNLWLLRLDAMGNLLWEKCFGDTTGGSVAVSVACTPDHGFILLGTANGYGHDVPFHYGGVFSDDWMVVKTDSAGNKQWCKDLGTTGDEQALGSILAIDNAYYLIGSSDSNNHDCTDTYWHRGVYTGDDYYLLKLDTAGNVLWDSSYGGSKNEVANYAMYDVRDSTIMITGSTTSDDYMVTGFHTCPIYSYADDMWVIKVNKNGKLLWEKCLGSAQDESGTGLCIAPNNGYIAYGNTFIHSCADTTIGDIGSQDCWLFALDGSGNEMANKIFGGTGYEFPASIIPYLNGYAATGASLSVVFTEGSSNMNHNSAFISYLNYWPLAVSNIQQNTTAMVVYPNPAQNSVRVMVNNTINGTLAILNYTGQIVYINNIKSNVAYTDIVTENWAKGMYIVRWQGADGRILTGKLIKE